jgi:Uma2 family endonuclease
MAIQSRPLTYEDLERLRETRDERLELIEGELFVTPAPSLSHQEVSANCYSWLRRAIAETGRGRVYYAPVDVRLAANTIIQPDLVVVLSDRLDILTRPRIEGAPSLIIEIVSPSTTTYDRVTKRGVYARYGVPEYWLVDFETWSVTVFSDPRGGRYQLENEYGDTAVSATIPGLSVASADLFAMVPVSEHR